MCDGGCEVETQTVDEQTNRQKDSEADRQIDRLAGSQAGRQTDRTVIGNIVRRPTLLLL